MYELIQAGPRSYYIDCPVKMGLYRTDKGVYLIDSGGDKSTGSKVRKILDQQGWTLLAILNTHAHADHIGGNRYLQSQTGCKVFASGPEAAITRHTLLGPTSLYGGCPPADLRHKFMLAQPSDVLPLAEHPDFPRELTVLPLPGHSPDMVGFRTPDDVVYLADCVSSAVTLEKYGVCFLYDAAAYLETLDTVEAMEARLFVPAHAEAVTNIRDLVRRNRDKVWEIARCLTDLCTEPASFETLLQSVFRRYGLTMNFEQYALVGSTVRSYLAWLRNLGWLEPEFADDRLLWRRV